MTFTVGGVDVTAVNVGATPAQAVYVGAEKVWPTALDLPNWLLSIGAEYVWHNNVDYGNGVSSLGHGAHTLRNNAPNFGNLTMWTNDASDGELHFDLTREIPAPWTVIGALKEAYIYADPWAESDQRLQHTWMPYTWNQFRGWDSGAADWGPLVQARFSRGGYDQILLAWRQETDQSYAVHQGMAGDSTPQKLTGTAPVLGVSNDWDTRITRRFKTAAVQLGLWAIVPFTISDADVQTIWDYIAA